MIHGDLRSKGHVYLLNQEYNWLKVRLLLLILVWNAIFIMSLPPPVPGPILWFILRPFLFIFILSFDNWGAMITDIKIGRTLFRSLASGKSLSRTSVYARREMNAPCWVLTAWRRSGGFFFIPLLHLQAPYQKKLMQLSMLTPEEVEWVNSYHSKCREILAPYLDESEQAWLCKSTEPLIASAWHAMNIIISWSYSVASNDRS